MIVTALGPILDRDGQGRKRWHVENEHGAWETRTRCWATPSRNLRHRQASFIGVDLEHGHARGGDWAGRIVHLERGPDDAVWCVAHLDNFAPPDEPVFWSPTLVFDEHDGTDVEITSVGVVQHPGQLGAVRHSPIQFLDGGIEWRGAVDRWPKSKLNGYRRGLVERACVFHATRERSQPLLVHDQGLDQADLDRLEGNERTIALTLASDLVVEGAWMNAPLRHRPGRIVDVR